MYATRLPDKSAFQARLGSTHTGGGIVRTTVSVTKGVGVHPRGCSRIGMLDIRLRPSFEALRSVGAAGIRGSSILRARRWVGEAFWRSLTGAGGVG